MRGITSAVRVSEEDVIGTARDGPTENSNLPPPAEAAYLDTRQRVAVDEAIRLLALTPEPDSATNPDDAVADYADITHQKTTQAFQSDYASASSPR